MTNMMISTNKPSNFYGNSVSFQAKKKNTSTTPVNTPNCPVLEHNLDPKAFNWLFVKYVSGFNDKHHCTNGFIGTYSNKIGAMDRLKRMGKPALDKVIKFDEKPVDSYDAIYICGVAKKGYNTKGKLPYWEKDNYKENLHVAIKPAPGQSDQKVFNNKWNLKISNGKFLPIPDEDELPERYKKLDDHFTKCRMFRWAACFYEKLNKNKET